MPTTQTHQRIDVHAQSTAQALQDEHDYAAHNYHPLPVVFAKAEGARVWDPEVRISFISFYPPLFLSVDPKSAVCSSLADKPFKINGCGLPVDPAVRAWPREASWGRDWGVIRQARGVVG